ncbi:MAG: hypothetical protein RL711_2085, partial [Bacteroidota bacterium]
IKQLCQIQWRLNAPTASEVAIRQT